MLHPSLQDKKFWEVLEFLMKFENKLEIKFILDQVGVEKVQFDKALLFLQEMNIKFSREILGEREFLIPNQLRPRIKIEFDLIDWLKFQAHFPLLQGFKDQPFHQKVAENLGKVEDRYKKFDLYRAVKVLGTMTKNILPTVLESEEEHVERSTYAIRSAIELAIEHKHHLKLRLQDHDELINVFSHRLVHIDGSLSLVAEETIEKTLIFLPLTKIDCIKESEEDYVPLHSILEIDDFISGIRAINGNEVRLVLKVIDPEKAQELTPLYHFLRKPYVISNPKGDLIWAASVEENEDVYEWLSNLESKVEILDPISFKVNYLSFCERKLKNSA
ncbi:MAG: WYL domain-containing protein [Bacteriovoracaceae bacterium]